MIAREVMTTNAVCCTDSSTVQEAVQLMKESDVGFLPVLSDFSRELVGVVTDRDLCVSVLAEGLDASQVRVIEFMTPRPASCSPDTDVNRVLGIMAEQRARRIVVVDSGNQVQGIVSVVDLIRHNAVSPEDTQQTLVRITAETPKAQAA